MCDPAAIQREDKIDLLECHRPMADRQDLSAAGIQGIFRQPCRAQKSKWRISDRDRTPDHVGIAHEAIKRERWETVFDRSLI